ncbi:MAG: methyltransferase domain-containing protein [Rhodobacteraceae bacterium]|nr:methyltransferase domain-containing protein [Paracoccaceae bacterium]
MSPAKDWNPESYARFGGLRLRPALDLLAHVGKLPGGGIVDLGCGNGAAGPALRARFAPERKIIGIDASPAMLTAAEGAGKYDILSEADAARWVPEAPVALIFSNAALQWLPEHEVLMPRLASHLAPGGVLAVQMPRQYGAPSHRFLRDFASEMFPDRFDLAAWRAPVSTPVEYQRMLTPHGRVDVWETEYVQRLDPVAEGHPVRRFTESTAMRPFLDRLTAAEARDFVARYESALAAAYPVEPDGSVLFPFRRLFFTLAV